ncbi:uncharacterized protein STEHIDRAFT_155515 [Stereum hirsutum FP-91666 SS1]|uniref:uncharacterized protein n=1 Tax=Stereum hirsutum (strain FP-91666) TaxID=721885 RepID=UPI0004410081|nr:uncharacterized protein STEHIDRAFT_155515 [Stereum hirsutum FP-91666 SS1]EIM88157.1 hypothetical protein STEHIDRAFT_155515 [Stereum hirsutum FP-91666 SS1]
MAGSGWGVFIERRPFVKRRLTYREDLMDGYFSTTIGLWSPRHDETVSHDVDMTDGSSQVAAPLNVESTVSYSGPQPWVMAHQPTFRYQSPVPSTINVQSSHHDVPMLDMAEQSDSSLHHSLGNNDILPYNILSASPELHIFADIGDDQVFSSQALSASPLPESNALPLQAICALRIYPTEPAASKHALDQASDSLAGISATSDVAILSVAPEQEDRAFEIDQVVAIGPSATGTGAPTPNHLAEQALYSFWDSLSRPAPSIPYASTGEIDRSPSVDEVNLEPIGSEVIDLRPMSDIAVPPSTLEQEDGGLELNQGAVSPTSAVPDLARLSDADDQAPDMCPPRPAESGEEEDGFPTAAADPSHASGEVSSVAQDSTDPACIEQESEEQPNENQVENVLVDDEDDLDDYEDPEAAATDERVHEDTSEPDDDETLPPAPLNILHGLSSHKRQELRQEAHDFLLDIVADLDPSTTSDEDDDLLGISFDVLAV